MEEELEKLRFENGRLRNKLTWVARCLAHEFYCPVCAHDGCNACENCHAETALADPWVKECLKKRVKWPLPRKLEGKK